MGLAEIATSVPGAGSTIERLRSQGASEQQIIAHLESIGDIPKGSVELPSSGNISNSYIQSLNDRVKNFNYEKEQKKYADRLSEFNPPQRNYDVFDLATSLSQGLSAQKQTDQPNSIGGGFALGFNQASQEMKQRDAEYAKARREIGLQAARMAMEDEQEATKYLDKSLYELAKASMGVGGKDSVDIRNYEYYKDLTEKEKEDWDGLKNQDPFSAYMLSKAKAEGALEGGSPDGIVLTTIERKMDEKFADIAADYMLKGAPQIKANLENLAEKIQILVDGDTEVSGPLVGLAPDAIKGIFMPEAASYIGDIRDVVFQSLREKLGAQFTEREGDRLVAAAFNSYLPEEMNIARLQRLYNTIAEAAKAKEDAIAYYQENRTLKGYTVVPLDFNSIMDSMISSTDYENMTDEELLTYFDLADKREQDVILKLVEQREGGE